jgi:DNA replication protein DnaC
MEEWSYERFAQALLSTEHASREAHGGEGRIRAARFPARKTLEEFDFTFQRSVKRTLIQHLGQLDFLAGRENVVLLGPPRHRQDPPEHRDRDPRLPGRPPRRLPHRHRMGRAARRRATHRAPRRRTRAAAADPAADRRRVGYIPFDPQAANLMFMLVSRRYERASMIVTSNKPFSGWGEIFGDEIVAAAMIDRLVHHAEIVALKGDSYRLRDRDLGRTPRDD